MPVICSIRPEASSARAKRSAGESPPSVQPATVRPTSWSVDVFSRAQNAGFTRSNLPSRPIIAIAVGACSKICRSESSAHSADCRAATSSAAPRMETTVERSYEPGTGRTVTSVQAQ